MKKVYCKIVGFTPLMHHRFTEENLYELITGKTKKRGESKEVVTPRSLAQKHVYQNKKGECFIPAEYINSAFISASSDYKIGGASKKSFKSIAGGCFRVEDIEVILKDSKNKVLKDFEVDVRKATNHQRGAVAVCRPRFDDWRCEFTCVIDDQLMPIQTAQQILEDAGRRCGIGSFRINKNGYFGAFRLQEFKVL